MPRKSQADKAKSRKRIVDAAATLIRQQGITATSVADIMKHAGMTHGGFYRHFEDKDQLIAEAIGEAFGDGLSAFSNGQVASVDEANDYISKYLSQEHLAEPASGCPIPLLSAEISRGTEEWQTSLNMGIARATKKLEEGLAEKPSENALVLLSTLVGAVSMARAMGDGALREELMAAVSKYVNNTYL